VFDAKAEVSEKSLPKIFSKLDYIWQTYAQHLILIGCFLTPLKLSLTYIFFGPAILLWLIFQRKRLVQKLIEAEWFFKPWLAFTSAFLLSSLFGFDPINSIASISGLFIYPIIILAIADTFKTEKSLKPLIALLCGQTIASLHTVFEASSSTKISRWFLGEVTEAGQLSLSVVAACGLILCLHRFSGTKITTKELLKNIFIFTAATLSLSFGSVFLAQSNSSLWQNFIAMTVLLSFLFFGFANPAKNLITFSSTGNKDLLKLCIRFVLPVLIAALILNLKRGPWAGASLAISIFILIYSPKLVLFFLASISLVLGLIAPVRQRLLDSSSHFFISGGRADIWQVGIEIAERFPLGIGHRNSQDLHNYSTLIPKQLTHFHNNFINILVEGSPLSLILFIAWLAAIIRYCLKPSTNHKLNPILKASACAIISWIVVGLFEYNLGDSEVMFVMYIMLGVVAGIKRSPSTK
jgi:hypothetical protein